ncbi:MAG: LysR family transcriptional regulator [Herbinix sp.]|jgi:DNA-binding transcriptional LysR family regulator|nr:LysR family transcriptional regulator [Herbinix sp.]
MLDFRMDTFLAVCRCMNLTKAAVQLNITQPAVTQHIHYLEDYYGSKLFAYEGKKMYLTHVGTLLYEAAVTMKHDDIYLKESIKDIDKWKKRLIFGATLTIGEFVMAEHIKEYLDLYPNVEIRMMVGNTSELLDKLTIGEIDFAMVEGNFPKSKFDYMVYSQEQYIPVCKQDYSFKREPEQLIDLLEERIIIREDGSGTREILEKNLAARNIDFEDFSHVIELGGMNAIKSLVQSGYGITFLYEAAVKKELADGSLKKIKLKDFQVAHDFNFVWNKGSVFSENYQEVCKLLKGDSK